MLVLDAGTGIRPLGLSLPQDTGPLHLLLTHLHLDHIQGLMFFAPLFQPNTEIVIWGPEAQDASLEDRIAPLHLGAAVAGRGARAALSGLVSRRAAQRVADRLGDVRADSVTHRGPTLGYRITEGDTSLAYIPDHEPALGASLDSLGAGVDLGLRAGPAAPRCSSTTASTPTTSTPHHVGWGHSSLTDALTFARRAEAQRLVLFHHDPMHSDAFLDGLGRTALEHWLAMGGAPDGLALASERYEIELSAAAAA